MWDVDYLPDSMLRVLLAFILGSPFQGKCCHLLLMDEERASERFRRQIEFSQLIRGRASILPEVYLTSRLPFVPAQALSRLVSGDCSLGQPHFDSIGFFRNESQISWYLIY